jgi:hypothetical protein
LEEVLKSMEFNEDKTEIILKGKRIERGTLLSKLECNTSGIRKVRVSNLVEEIGERTFCDLENLVAVVFEDKSNLRSISPNVFKDKKDKEDKVVILSKNPIQAVEAAGLYQLSEDEWNVACNEPIKISEDKTVVTLNARSLGGWDIGNLVGSDFSNVKKIIVSKSVETLVDQLFRSNSFGRDVEIVFEPGSRLKIIGKEVFKGVPIKKITIPKSVTEIGNYAFSDCNDLLEIVFESGSKLKDVSYYSFPSAGVILFDDNDEDLVTVLKNAGVRKYAVSDVWNDARKSVSVENGQLTLKGKFFDCGIALEAVRVAVGGDFSKIRRIVVSKTVKNIENQAFAAFVKFYGFEEVEFEKDSELEKISEDVFGVESNANFPRFFDVIIHDEGLRPLMSTIKRVGKIYFAKKLRPEPVRPTIG